MPETKDKKTYITKKRIDSFHETLLKKIKEKDVTIYGEDVDDELIITGNSKKDENAISVVEVSSGQEYVASLKKLMPLLREKKYSLREYNKGSIALKMKNINNNKK